MAQTPAEEAYYQSWLAQRNTGEGQTQIISHTHGRGAGLGTGARWVVIRDLRERMDALMTPAETRPSSSDQRTSPSASQPC